jgi:hypothetical protein
MMFVFNFWVAVLCWIMGVHELANGNIPAAIAYGGFGIGYVGLAWLYMTVT